MACALCIHHAFQHFDGKVVMEVSRGMALRMSGTFHGVDTSAPVEVRVQSPIAVPLPLWLRAYAFASRHLCPAAQCSGDTCVVHRAAWDGDVLECNSPLIDFETWSLRVPYLPDVPLTSLIGMCPVHVVIQQGDREYSRMVVQRRQHCVHLAH